MLRALPTLAVCLGALVACEPLAEDGTPHIMGASSLSADAVVAWWDTTGKGQPEALGAPVHDVLRAYLADAEAEGVRGDLALAQAILETGWFTSANAAINSFAGIGYGRDGGTGYPFPDAATGVRAHVQLLKKYALGNDVGLALPDVAPPAQAHAGTWGQLCGTWASDPAYWATIAKVHARMLR